MKHLLILLLLVQSSSGLAQTANGIPIKEINAVYMSLSSASTRNYVDFDFGLKSNASRENGKFTIRDAGGNELNFVRIIDALNFMDQQGYDLVQSYAYVTSSLGYVTVYVLKKR